MRTVLFTSAKEDSEIILKFFKNEALKYIHTPLEVYTTKKDDSTVTELVLFDLEDAAEEELKNFQNNVKILKPDAIIFHSRRSVTRILAAFPKWVYRKLQVLSANTAITKKLKKTFRLMLKPGAVGHRLQISANRCQALSKCLAPE